MNKLFLSIYLFSMFFFCGASNAAPAHMSSAYDLFQEKCRQVATPGSYDPYPDLKTSLDFKRAYAATPAATGYGAHYLGFLPEMDLCLEKIEKNVTPEIQSKLLNVILHFASLHDSKSPVRKASSKFVSPNILMQFFQSLDLEYCKSLPTELLVLNIGMQLQRLKTIPNLPPRELNEKIRRITSASSSKLEEEINSKVKINPGYPVSLTQIVDALLFPPQPDLVPDDSAVRSSWEILSPFSPTPPNSQPGSMEL